MPKTFVDAITITRHLGIRYLWIDSLCICQDDSEDWARESSRMCEVYRNAHVVIAANRSIDSEGGCFHLRQPRRSAVIDLGPLRKGVCATLLPLSEQQVLGDSAMHRIETTIFKGEPLASRGW